MALIATVFALLLVGSVDIPAADVVDILRGHDIGNEAWRFIVVESRIPLAVTAALSGAALAVCGLLLQTAFNYPLADPSILGVSTGSSLGVAIVMLS